MHPDAFSYVALVSVSGPRCREIALYWVYPRLVCQCACLRYVTFVIIELSTSNAKAVEDGLLRLDDAYMDWYNVSVQVQHRSYNCCEWIGFVCGHSLMKGSRLP